MGWPFLLVGWQDLLCHFRGQESLRAQRVMIGNRPLFLLQGPGGVSKGLDMWLGSMAIAFLAEVWNRCLQSSMLKSILNGASISLLVRLESRSDLGGVKSVSVKNLTNAFWMPGMADKTLLFFFQKVRSTNSHSICRRTDNG